MPGDSSWLVVTPARNEEEHLPKLAASLAAQTIGRVARWVIVDDGSTDNTAHCLDEMSLPFPITMHSRVNTGGLDGASERVAFEEGVRQGLDLTPDAAWIVKIDADLVLADDFVERIDAVADGSGLVGGVIVEPGVHSQPHHVRGGLRAYSRAGWNAIQSLPMALGWDVLDEVHIREHGLRVQLVPDARAEPSRTTWSSEGLLRGRVRGGLGMRWTGYHPAYFAIRVARHIPKRPRVLGAAGMVWGYVTGGPGPFPSELKRANRRAQTQRLRAFLRSPRTWTRENMRSPG